MSTSEDRSARCEAARFVWVSELLAMLDLRAGSPEWERQWQTARRLEEQYECAKQEFLRARAED